ncbi:MAG: hypothetical protein WKG07_45495 [Hymenobacter sp.]
MGQLVRAALPPARPTPWAHWPAAAPTAYPAPPARPCPRRPPARWKPAC